MINQSKVLPVGTVLRSKSRSYTIVEVLGQGGFGITYHATAVVAIENIKAKAHFAIKEHFVDRYCERDGVTYAVAYSRPVADEVENSRKDFLSEARRLHDLSKGQKRHPNIVCVNETFEANNTAYFVMEYLKGESLSNYVKRCGPLSDSDMRGIMIPVIDAVAFLHRENITHLDIKPGNIMLTRDDDETLRPVLIDFGLSRHFDPDTGEPSSSIQQAGFSEGYAPIEQVEAFSHFYPGTDVYSLGATMLYALTGNTPPTATNLDDETLRNSIPAGLPASTVAAITAAMHHFRKQRPADAGALLSILTEGDARTRIIDTDAIIPEIYDSGRTTMTPAAKPTPKPDSRVLPSPTTKSKKGKYIGIGAVALLVILCAAWFTNGFGLSDKTKEDHVQESPAPSVPVGSDFVEDALGLNMKMVWVEGGEFMMGGTSEQGSDAKNDEYPVRRVKLDSYYIGETEVTQAQWEKVMGSTIQQQVDKAGQPVFSGIGPDYPMYYVSWEEAQAFCQELSRITGRNYCLPTEAQWEYAARGGKNDKGTKYSGSASIDAVAWYLDNSGNPHPVKTKRSNGLGLYDMSGNVCEWCSDWYYYYNVNDNGDRPESVGRVLRGGSWNDDARKCRVSNRDYDASESSFRDGGFRVAVCP